MIAQETVTTLLKVQEITQVAEPMDEVTRSRTSRSVQEKLDASMVGPRARLEMA